MGSSPIERANGVVMDSIGRFGLGKHRQYKTNANYSESYAVA